MVAGLVAVHVSAEQAFGRNVLIISVAVLGEVASEEVVEVGYELLVAAHNLLQAVHVLGHVEGIIQGIAFNESLAYGLLYVEIFLEGAVGVAGRARPSPASKTFFQ